jgi:hypothetical protein
LAPAATIDRAASTLDTADAAVQAGFKSDACAHRPAIIRQ